MNAEEAGQRLTNHGVALARWGTTVLYGAMRIADPERWGEIYRGASTPTERRARIRGQAAKKAQEIGDRMCAAQAQTVLPDVVDEVQFWLMIDGLEAAFVVEVLNEAQEIIRTRTPGKAERKAMGGAGGAAGGGKA